MMTTAMDELRDLHAARFAEIAALREMLVEANSRHGAGEEDLSGRMREAVTEILRLQRSISRLGN